VHNDPVIKTFVQKQKNEIVQKQKKQIVQKFPSKVDLLKKPI